MSEPITISGKLFDETSDGKYFVGDGGALYEKQSMIKMLRDYNKRNAKYGTFGREHCLGDISHNVKNLDISGTGVNITVDVLDTPKGKMLQNILKANCLISFGVNGYGTIDESGVTEITSLNTIDIIN